MQYEIHSFDLAKINYDIVRKKKRFYIFLHGAGGDLKAWDLNLFHKNGFSTIAIDLSGHGKSERISQSLENATKDVYEVIKHEKVRDFVLVGHCFGGMIAITFAKLYP